MCARWGGELDVYMLDLFAGHARMLDSASILAAHGHVDVVGGCRLGLGISRIF